MSQHLRKVFNPGSVHGTMAHCAGVHALVAQRTERLSSEQEVGDSSSSEGTTTKAHNGAENGQSNATGRFACPRDGYQIAAPIVATTSVAIINCQAMG